MKERKFRGKATNGTGWIYGSLVESSHTWKNCRPHRSWIVEIAYSNGGWLTICKRSPVIDDSVGMFTGAHDMNDQEIYEGDIVEYNGDRYEIRYIERCAKFAPVKPGVIFYIFALENCRVVGNTFDTPEKMEVK